MIIDPHMTTPDRVGRIPVEGGFEIGYRVYGAGSKAVIGLHGGPGMSSRYLNRLAEIVDDDHQLILYDQLGAGDSDWPSGDFVWTVGRFVDELETVRSYFGLDRVTLVGQSWGGMLALQYALDHPDRVRGLVLSNTTASAPAYIMDISQHRMALGQELHALMLRHEHRNTEDDPEYCAAVRELEIRHLRRSTPFDVAVSKREFEEVVPHAIGIPGPAYTLWGPHEFKGDGPLVEWDVTARLGEIRVPTLVVCGAHDELTPERCSRPIAEGIADTEYVIFGNSSHLIILEKEADAYLAAIRDFIARKGL